MLHLFVHQYLFLKCITEFLHWNYHWVFLWFCRLYSDGLALGVWFMTSCCCLVEFGFSCFNHASIESWFANYSVLDILQNTTFNPFHRLSVDKYLFSHNSLHSFCKLLSKCIICKHTFWCLHHINSSIFVAFWVVNVLGSAPRAFSHLTDAFIQSDLQIGKSNYN